MRKFLCAAMVGFVLCRAGWAQQDLAPKETAKATFAGGCFWCMESEFEKIDGIGSVVSGYTGGSALNPGYTDVSLGGTGDVEAVEVVYDPSKVSYEKLLDVFWGNIDPTQADGQFADIGTQYQAAVFYHDEGQRRLAEQSKEEVAASGKFKKPIVTRILPAGKFFQAEDYHQDYYKKRPEHYQSYRVGSGREAFIRKNWGPKAENGE